jgi:hypothetical protein
MPSNRQPAGNVLKHPKNVRAVIDWYKKHRPDMVQSVESMFDVRHATNKTIETLVGISLQSFEAGREFQKEHPEIESGAGYLT